ncbi:hypothetical protein MRBLMI12_000515 [Microbacterium sp. LMI12-1-1.1]|uniref:hypothetical protein n=1 Tax=Microbacterium sp. LMI12-1-1.1 TaxID=3135225 RepID=UPI0034343D7D
MALPPTPSDDSWVDEILDEVRGEFWCTIDVYTPGTKGKFDPLTDTRAGGTAEVVHISQRAARAQHSGRMPQETAGAYEWGTKQRYHFQIELTGEDPFITDGMLVRVTSTRRMQALTQLRFQVTKAVNSDHAPILTIQTVTEARAVADG